MRLAATQARRSLGISGTRHGIHYHAAAETNDEYMRRARQRILSRKAKVIIDTLSPMHSHLLDLALHSYLPPQHAQHTNGLPGLWSSADELALPQGHHLVYFPLQAQHRGDLIGDGADSDHCPGAPYVRRMWAAGSMTFDDDWPNAFRLDGRRVCCVETLGEPYMATNGGSNSGDETVFVEVTRRYGLVRDNHHPSGDQDAAEAISQPGGAIIHEVRKLAFKRKPPPPPPPNLTAPQRITTPFPRTDSPNQEQPSSSSSSSSSIAADTSTSSRETSFKLTPDPLLLFQFSALTYNAHAIHLDPEYARAVEGYPERLVHGPLTVVLVMALLRSTLAAKTKTGGSERWFVQNIRYRNLRPLFVGQELTVRLREDLSAQDDDDDDDDDDAAAAAGEEKKKKRKKKMVIWIEGPDGKPAVKGTSVAVLRTRDKARKML
ncbi:hypothetical protein B0H63DRAFT_269836 [Podospora didyma]|uniref:MaoC-like domain-containing protein n=1 Tax=Podospora didyma TaxID=330526 RepID=A0AAE0N9G4_9PEZI|nr:hypothetical protein B0H63DRAFT_269836 [Podospora didyma]